MENAPREIPEALSDVVIDQCYGFVMFIEPSNAVKSSCCFALELNNPASRHIASTGSDVYQQSFPQILWIRITPLTTPLVPRPFA